MAAGEHLANHFVIGFGEGWVVETHAGCEGAEDLLIGTGFAWRGKCGSRELQVVVAVGRVEMSVCSEEMWWRGG